MEQVDTMEELLTLARELPIELAVLDGIDIGDIADGVSLVELSPLSLRQ